MSFPEVLGNEEAKEALARWIRDGRIPHAILLVGPDGIGKFLLAQAVARAVLCARSGEQPCGTCPSCKKCLAAVHPDLLVLEPAGRGGSIAIDAIRGARRPSVRGGTPPSEEGASGAETSRDDVPRESDAPSASGDAGEREGLLGWLARKPLEGTRKCAIVRDADTLTAEAVGSLLKTLEEPPPGTVLLLVAPALVDLPDTLVSRCRLLRLRELDEEIVARVLVEKEGASPPAAKAAARAGAGSLAASLEAVRGDAARMLGVVERLLAGEVHPLRLREDVFEGLASGAAAAERRTRARAFFRSATSVLRERWRVLVASGRGESYVGGGRSPFRLEKGLEAAGEALRGLDGYVDPGLLLDDFALALAGEERTWSGTRRSGTD